MKNVTGIVTSSGNVDTTNAVKCEIDSEGLGHIMSILSNMYSNAPLAVLREYACNARDSHIAAGQTRPVEVTLPSALQPSLLIQDFGLGLSKDEILSVYGTYGKSTKRDTNEQVGAFGIGSKSAFTMGQQFVVTGVKDGVKTVALFALNADNVGTMNILHEGPTDEPNGVLVSLAVEDVDRMAETAEEFFGTWQPGTVLVNGVQPTSVYDQGFAVNDKVHAVPGENGVTVVMGAVGYPVSRDILAKVYNDLARENSPAKDMAYSLRHWSSNAVYLDVEIGDVDIAPTRESLRDTPRTISTIKALIESIATDLITSVQDKVNEAPTWRAGMETLRDSRDLLKGFNVSLKDVTWNGKALGDIAVELPVVTLVKKSYRSSVKVVSTIPAAQKFTFDLTRADKTLVITGVNEDEAGKVTRFAKRFMENNTYEYLVLSPARKGKFDWFTFGHKGDTVPTMTLEEYRESLKTIRASRPKMVNEPSYDQAPGKASKEIEDRTPLSEILESGLDIIVFQDETPYKTWMLDEALKDRELIILLPTQSLAALEKRVGDEVEIIDGRREVRRIAQEAVDALTEDQKAVLTAKSIVEAYQHSTWSDIRKSLTPRWDDIINDDFKDVFTKVDEAREVYNKGKDGLERVLEAGSFLGKAIAGTPTDWTLPDVDALYPLLQHCMRGYYYENDKQRALRLSHVVHYLNGVALSE